jgi:hypothetical protein
MWKRPLLLIQEWSLLNTEGDLREEIVSISAIRLEMEKIPEIGAFFFPHSFCESHVFVGQFGVHSMMISPSAKREGAHVAYTNY